MKKRILSMLLAIVMVVGLMPTTALAADAGSPRQIATVDKPIWKEYTDITEAINVAKVNSGSTLMLRLDFTADPATINEGNFTIDLCDRTWTSSSPVLQIGGNADITIIDSGVYDEGQLLSTDKAAHEIVLSDSAQLKIDKGAIGSICYKGGTIDLSENDDPTGITIYNDTDAAVTPGDTTIKLPDGYVMLDGSGNAVDTLAADTTYTVGSTPTTPELVEYPLWVGGEQVTSKNLEIIGGDGKATYDPEENTLTLNDYSYTGAGYQVDDETVAAIYYCGSDTLDLVLEGESTVTQQSEIAPTDSNGIYSSKAGMTVSGTGSLTAAGGTVDERGHSYGVYAYGNITIESGKLTGIGGALNGQYGFSIGVHGKTITVDDGSLTAIGNSTAVVTSSENSITINGGEVVANGAKWAFSFTPTIGGEFDPAVWYGESEADAMNNGAKDKSFIANTDDAKYAKIAPAVDYDLWVGGKRVTSANAYDVFGDSTVSYNTGTNTLTLNGYEYTGTGYEYNRSFEEVEGGVTIEHVLTAAIYSGLRELTIKLEGENKLTNTANEGDGIYAGDTTTISGNGSVEIVTNEGDGIRLNGNGDRTLTISGVNVSINAGESGICNVLGTMELTNGVFDITAGKNGIYLEGDLTITNSTVEITAETKAANVFGFFLGEDAWYQWTTTKGGTMTSSKKAPFVYNRQDSTLTYLKIEPAATTYTITFEPNGGSVDTSSMTTVDGKLQSLPTPTRSGYDFKGWFDAATGGAQVTASTVFSADTTIYAQWTKQSSGGGGGSSNTTSKTEKNEDGSTTTTTTNKTTGTVTETTKYPDGSTTTVETKKDGSSTETSKTADGTTGTIVTDKDGNVTEVSAKVPAAAVKDAEKSGEAVQLPIEVEATNDADEAVEIGVDVPAGGAKVEIPVEDVTSGTVVVIVNEDGTEEIVKTSAVSENGVVITLDKDATIKVIDNSKHFADVHPVDHWADEAIDFVVAREIYSGTGANTFHPNNPMTRAMLAVVLHKLADNADHAFDGVFHDVVEDSWYEEAVHWAADNSIVSGYGNGHYGPNDNITREQLAVMLWRFAQYMGRDVSVGEDTNILSYEDAFDISEYAIPAMQWACGAGIMGGYGNGYLGPKDGASRAQVAQMLMNFISK